MLQQFTLAGKLIKATFALDSDYFGGRFFSNWCSFFDAKREGFGFNAQSAIASATLHEGQRSKALAFEGRSFRVALHDPVWSDEALIELTYAAPTETADETPRTGP